MKRGNWMRLPLCLVLFPTTLASAVGQGTPPAAISHSTEAAMSYAEAKAFLAKHTEVVELADDAGARVAVCPAWQGRVMTSTCGGPQGLSFGFINRDYIAKGQVDKHFNNYGGEERMWLSPEGGQFSLWFKPGQAQDLAHWFTAPDINEGPWAVVSTPGDPYVRMLRKMHIENASGTPFELEVVRDVRLLTCDELSSLFGAAAAGMMSGGDVKLVAYETINKVTNRGAPMTKERGLISIWILGMLNAGPQTVVTVPYRPGEQAQLGPVVITNYFGEIPADRLQVTPEAILFRADGACRSKLGVPQARAKNLLGSIDYASGVLTLVNFTMPADPTRHAYLNNRWELPQESPFVGDVVNSYNDGSPAPGKKGLGAFYEIESLSPALALATGETLVHHHRTLHVQGPQPALARLARETLGVDLDRVRSQMLAK